MLACVLYVMFCVVARVVLLLCLFVVCLVACGGCVFVFVFLRMLCVLSFEVCCFWILFRLTCLLAFGILCRCLVACYIVVM